MNKKQLNELKNNFRDDLLDLGYELVDIDFVNEMGMDFLRFFIYKDEGITSEDTAIASRYISEKLDELDPIDSQYYLDVSSPDLSRPLKTDRDLERNIGEKVEIGFFKKINGSKSCTGVLEKFDNEYIFINVDEETRKFERSVISQIKPSVF